MTFLNSWNKILDQQQQLQQQQTDKELINKHFKDIPFVCEYDRLEPTTDKCCFNHKIGLPISSNNVLPSPIYQWQYDYIIRNLEEHKYNWVLKATGIGLSEIVLRWILYKSLVNDNWSNGIVPIFTGVNYDLARRLIHRAATMLYSFFPYTKENERTLRVNDVEITAFPGGHMDTARSLTNTRMYFLDEFDFFEEEKNKESGRKVAERQIAKSDPDILIASTPNRPNGPMQEIQDEGNSLYNKIYLPYSIGLGTLYTAKHIQEQMKSPSFEQEYNLKYLGNVGNIFNPIDLDAAITNEYSLNEDNPYAVRYMGIDPAFGSSQYGVTIIEFYDGKLNVLYSDSWERPLFDVAIQRILDLIKRYNVCKVLVDGANPSVIRTLKHALGGSEYLNYDLIEEKVTDTWITGPCEYNKICPIIFRTKHKPMLQKLLTIVNKRKLRIHPSFTKLIVSLRTATGKTDDFSLDKVQTSYSDCLDSLRLATYPIQFRSE
jgi:hypothetical protein